MAAPSTAPPRWLVPAVLVLAALAFVTAIDGAFVYDDTWQIVANPLIQENALIGEALTSDVWAFKGAEASDEARSNYWRPTFVAWMIVNHRLFGLNPFGWHLTNILLHVLVTGLVLLLARRLGLNGWLSAAIAVLFAVHPVHVESVAWIAGSPDVLLGAALLGALLLVADALDHSGWWRWALAILLAGVAMGAKEVGIMAPFLVAALVMTQAPDGAPSWKARVPMALKAAAPFAALAVVYVLLRQAVLGQFAQETSWDHGFLEAALTAPALLFFYLRQLVVPFELGPSYPLRPLGPDGLSITSFWGPLLAVGLAVAGALWMARRGRIQAFGLALFALLLLPAFNIPAFPPEHLVHDRYLYVPLLGVLLLVIPTVATWLAEGRRTSAQAATRTFYGAALLAIPLLALTLSYSRVWTSELTLWERNIETDPTSAFAWSQYGVALRDEGRTAEAGQAFARSLDLRPMSTAVLGQADGLIAAGQLDEAERVLRMLVQQEPSRPGPYERLAVIYQQQERLDEAEAALRNGLAYNPALGCSFGSNLGVVLYLQGRTDEARSTLEEALQQADRELAPACWVGHFHLGNLEREAGDHEAARTQFERYLALTAGSVDVPEVRRRRARAQAYLADLP